MTAEERKIVENKISELKKQMADVHGSKCEVYSRVVGYLRPVQNWNKGKREEFTMRKTKPSAKDMFCHTSPSHLRLASVLNADTLRGNILNARNVSPNGCRSWNVRSVY